MTREEFAQTGFMQGMTAKYKSKEYLIVALDFEEDLIGIYAGLADEDEPITWVRCENIELVDK